MGKRWILGLGRVLHKSYKNAGKYYRQLVRNRISHLKNIKFNLYSFCYHRYTLHELHVYAKHYNTVPEKGMKKIMPLIGLQTTASYCTSPQNFAQHK